MCHGRAWPGHPRLCSCHQQSRGWPASAGHDTWDFCLRAGLTLTLMGRSGPGSAALSPMQPLQSCQQAISDRTGALNANRRLRPLAGDDLERLQRCQVWHMAWHMAETRGSDRPNDVPSTNLALSLHRRRSAAASRSASVPGRCRSAAAQRLSPPPLPAPPRCCHPPPARAGDGGAASPAAAEGRHHHQRHDAEVAVIGDDLCLLVDQLVQHRRAVPRRRVQHPRRRVPACNTRSNG